MRLDALLRAHGFMKVERPPELWEADTELTRFLPLLGEMIAAGLAEGAHLAELTLNASNVVETGEDEEQMAPAPGEYVAMTVRGAADFGPDDSWHASRPPRHALLLRLQEQLRDAGACFAYVRRLPPEGSVTVFLARCRAAAT